MARQNENGPNKTSLRRRLEVALADRRTADVVLDAITALEVSYNALLAKMDADVGITDTDYESTLAVTPTE